MRSEDRTDPPLVGDADVLLGMLRWQRQTLEWKCSGLTEEELKRRAVEPSTLSLLGLLRHMTSVEMGWFGTVLQQRELPPLWQDADDGDEASFDVADADCDAAFAQWRRACADSDTYLSGVDSLDVTVDYQQWTFSVRYVVAHMVAEYARHNGHADLLRERIDGSTGE